MRFFTSQIFFSLISLTCAHFQLQYPGPRGPFSDDDQPKFCDGYVSGTTNRTTFPLDNAYYTFKSGHPSWSMGVYLSTTQNATSFQDFSNTTLAKPLFRGNGEGQFCIPIDIGASGISGVADGVNVTLQFFFDGGDGALYQCADLTLSKAATTPSSVTCMNATTTPPTNHNGGGHMINMQTSLVAVLLITNIALIVT